MLSKTELKKWEKKMEKKFQTWLKETGGLEEEPKEIREYTDLQYWRNQKKNMPKPENVEGVIWAHGFDLATDRTEVENLKIFLSLLGTEAEVACSSPQYVVSRSENERRKERLKSQGRHSGWADEFLLGKVGIYFEGECTQMFKVDVVSFIHPISGERFYGDSIRQDVCVSSYKEMHENYSDKIGRNSKCYAEAFVRPRKVVSVWISEAVYVDEYDTVEEIIKICEENNIKITII